MCSIIFRKFRMIKSESDPSPSEAKAGGSEVQGQLDPVFKTKTKTKPKRELKN
jgi:hypothetical protein